MADHHCPSTSLPGLPSELVELVANWLSPEDLLALHGTCRETHYKLHRMVSDVHFSEKTVLLSSPDSMQMLVDLSKVFGARLKKINIHLDMIERYNPYDRGKELSEERIPWKDRRAGLRGMRRREDQMYEAHKRYWKAQAWVDDLAEVLQNVVLSQSGISLALIPSPAFKKFKKVPTTAICGKKKIERRLLGNGFHTSWLGFSDEEQAALMHVIGEGERQISARVGSARECQPSTDRKPTKLLQIQVVGCPIDATSSLARGLGLSLLTGASRFYQEAS
ncbi:hypothetical protein LTR17_020848 [Elasticomyces elasticus]|nr:hypothetical protein LTR17_020848 [Elasticomyces elasticus]